VEEFCKVLLASQWLYCLYQKVVANSFCTDDSDSHP